MVSNMLNLRTIGRLFLSLLFIISAASKFTDYNNIQSYAVAKMKAAAPFLPLPMEIYQILFLISVLMELGGGLLIALGIEQLGALLCMIFLAIITPIMHDFWNLDGADFQLQFVHFFKNLQIIGGLIILYIGAENVQVYFRRITTGRVVTVPSSTGTSGTTKKEE